jgi:hypothetical protein
MPRRSLSMVFHQFLRLLPLVPSTIIVARFEKCYW